MAEMTQGNGERAAERVIKRYALYAFLAVAGPSGAWVGARLVSQLDRVADAVIELRTDVAVMKTDIGYLKERVKP